MQRHKDIHLTTGNHLLAVPKTPSQKHQTLHAVNAIKDKHHQQIYYTYLFLPVGDEFLMRFSRVACSRDSMIDASLTASSCNVTSSAASSVSCDVSAFSGCWQSSRNLSERSSVFILFTLLVWSTHKQLTAQPDKCMLQSTETALAYIHDHLINAIGSQKYLVSAYSTYSQPSTPLTTIFWSLVSHLGSGFMALS